MSGQLNTHPHELPQRITLADQTAALLRDNIHRGVWPRELPPEPMLARELKVGRNTVRAAVDQLAKEGLVRKAGPGRRHRIVAPARVTQAQAEGRTVRYLSPVPLEEIDQVTQVILNGIQARLSAEGYHLEFEHHAGVFRSFSERQLKELTSQPDTAGWMLLWATREVQEWFAQSGIPCIVTGSVHAGVALPNVEYDFRAACRHAAGAFIGRGHEHLAFLGRTPSNASEMASETAFLVAARSSRKPVQARTLVCEDNRLAICAALDKLIRLSPRPTALLVALAEHVLTVVGHLHRRGLRIPQDMAIISRVSDIYSDFIVPTIARYRLDTAMFSRKSADLILHVIKHGAGHRGHLKVMPEFVSGESL